MILVDANILLYAYHRRAPQHEPARAWVEAAFSGREPVRLAWVTILAFLRISTNPRVFEMPLSIAEATAAVASWLPLPAVAVLDPGDRYSEILSGTMKDGQTVGPLVMDAALAALAIEHGATLCSTDGDFRRFRGLRLQNPLRPGTR